MLGTGIAKMADDVGSLALLMLEVYALFFMRHIVHSVVLHVMPGGGMRFSDMLCCLDLHIN